MGQWPRVQRGEARFRQHPQISSAKLSCFSFPWISLLFECLESNRHSNTNYHFNVLYMAMREERLHLETKHPGCHGDWAHAYKRGHGRVHLDKHEAQWLELESYSDVILRIPLQWSCILKRINTIAGALNNGACGYATSSQLRR